LAGVVVLLREAGVLRVVPLIEAIGVDRSVAFLARLGLAPDRERVVAVRVTLLGPRRIVPETEVLVVAVAGAQDPVPGIPVGEFRAPVEVGMAVVGRSVVLHRSFPPFQRSLLLGSARTFAF